jgi:hypothetical protein
MRHVTWIPMTVPIVLLTAATLLAGCATGGITWDKPGVAQADREHDENACLRAAIGKSGEKLLAAPYCIDRDIYVQCMEARGYTVRSK